MRHIVFSYYLVTLWVVGKQYSAIGVIAVRHVPNEANVLGQPIPIRLLRARCDGDGVVAVLGGVVNHLLERHLVPALLERGIGHGVL